MLDACFDVTSSQDLQVYSGTILLPRGLIGSSKLCVRHVSLIHLLLLYP